eukprot:3947086-Amphidinium_carterae.1
MSLNTLDGTWPPEPSTAAPARTSNTVRDPTAVTLEAEGRPKDLPAPGWNGEKPDKNLQRYIKSVQIWRLATRTPGTQQGVQLLSAST